LTAESYDYLPELIQLVYPSLEHQEVQSMRFTLAQLEAFYWVARLGSVGRAAVHMNLAQPTVSLRLRELERALDMRLFDRLGRTIRVADEGLALLEHATVILGEASRIREQAGGEERLAGILSIGVTETFALVCLPRLLERLGHRHPTLRPELIVATSSELEHELRQRRIDIAFVINPSPDPGLQLLALGIQETCWAAARRLGLPSFVRPADLRDLPILSNSPPSPMHRQIMSWFQAAGMEPLRLSICNSVTVIRDLVCEGIAVGLLPRKMIDAEIAAERIQVLHTRPPHEPARLHAAYRAGEGSRAIRTTIDAAREILGVVEFLAPL
jgi:DNA-binding transcriptional LysR family regulator